MGHYKGLKLLDILSTLEANLAKKRYQKGSIYWYFVSYDKYTEEPLYSHFKLYWNTFSDETRVIAINTCLNLD